MQRFSSPSRATAYTELSSYNAALKDMEEAIRCCHERMDGTGEGEDPSTLTRVYRKKIRYSITQSFIPLLKMCRILELSSKDSKDERKAVEQILSAVEVE